jgi:3-hydroxyacyl-[acyl-carrier-protein] dehydratase
MPPDPQPEAQPDPLSQLPHRDPFRFISRLVSLTAGQSGEGTWSLRGHEPFFTGHFPGDPIVPGVLISEALAQLSGLVALHGADGAPSGRLAHVDIRFDTPVRPPAEILLKSTLTRTLGRLSQFDVSASVGGIAVARGSLMLATA